MKKTIVSFSFIFAFVVYSLYQYFGMSQTLTFVAANNTPGTKVTLETSQPIITTKNTVSKASPNKAVTQTQSGQPVPIPTPTPIPVPTPTPIPAPVAVSAPAPVVKNMYNDGNYTGSIADAYYGNIQVQATIQNGKIVDVQFLQYPSDRSRSVSINTRAMPILKSEAISSQSANVDIVSGATDSSQAFVQSLSSALAQALNS